MSQFLSCSLKSILYSEASLELLDWKQNLCEISRLGGTFASILMTLGWDTGWDVEIVWPSGTYLSIH